LDSAGIRAARLGPVAPAGILAVARGVGRPANPAGSVPFSNRIASKNEIAYARLADETPHLVVSTTLEKAAWKTTGSVRDLEEIRRLKQQHGKDMHVVGGATLVSSLMNEGLIDELGLMVNPLVLGGGKALCKDVKERHALKLVQAKPFRSG
jgi:dihydrofolate reductase